MNMDLKTYKLKNSSKPKDEHIIFQVLTDTNLQKYCFCDNSYNTEGELSNKHRHVFFFPNLDVNQNDFVFVHNVEGDYNTAKNKGGSINHHIYWGINTCVWNDDIDGVFLIEISDVKYSSIT